MTLAAPVPAAPAPEARSFRDALGRFATGVAFVTATPHGKPTGLIVNSLSSVSLEPALVSFCPARSSLTWSRMRRAERFGVNILGRQHERFAKRATPAGADRFAGLDWELGHHGVPLLTDALATLEFDILAEHPAGDHWIVVGRVEAVRTSPPKDPLVFFAGAFATLQQLTAIPSAPKLSLPTASRGSAPLTQRKSLTTGVTFEPAGLEEADTSRQKATTSSSRSVWRGDAEPERSDHDRPLGDPYGLVRPATAC